MEYREWQVTGKEIAKICKINYEKLLLQIQKNYFLYRFS